MAVFRHQTYTCAKYEILMSSQISLLAQRRFSPFFWTQLLGAFNDNLFKQTLVLLVVYHGAQYSTMPAALVTNLAAGLFILPFVLFSALAGQLADKFDKARLIQTVKGTEVAIMGLASWGFFAHDIVTLLTSLFLMGCHSAFFGPAKYAVLPQVLKEQELVGGNGLLEMGTFLAILLGTLAAGVLVSLSTDPMRVSATLTAVAVAGLAVSLAIPRLPAPAPALTLDFNPIRQTWEMLKFARQIRSVWLSLLGISWFWFFGALLLAQLPALGKDVLQGSEHVVTLMLAVFSLSVALGSLMCEKLSGRGVDIGLVPFGSLGLSIFAADLYFALRAYAEQAAAVTPLTVAEFVHAPGALRVLGDLFFIGVFAGLYIVPLYALVQLRTQKSHQSRVMAVNNVLNAVFMVGSAALAALLLAVGVSVPTLVLVAAVLNGVVALYIYTLVPEFLWRFLGWMLAHTLYRIRIQGRDWVPQEGPALLCPNHVTYADALFLSALSPRPIRFVMDHGIFKLPLAKFVFKAVKAIPIASAKTHPDVLEAAYVEIGKALDNGELVCIFPEGLLTRDGQMNPFRPGVLRILQRNPVPVVPVALAGLWGSALSRTGWPLSKRLLVWRPWRRVSVAVSAPLPELGTEVSAIEALQEQVQCMKHQLEQ